jgi:hypothetical protein
MARGAVAIEQVAGDCACATPARHNKDSVVIVRRMFVLPDVRREYAHHQCTETTAGNHNLRA